MKYSEKLNGYWEEGYHYYVEIRDDRMTVRGYRRDITLETKISYDARALERGERTVIKLDDNVLSRDYEGNPFTMIKELAYDGGELKFLYYYTIMGETLYTLKKVDCGPFDHIIIRDDEYLPRLQGTWFKWSRDKDSTWKIVINGNRLTLPGVESRPFHAVSYKYDKNTVYLVPENLIDSDFGSWTQIEVEPDRLTTRMMVFDATVPLSVFARKEMLDKIDIPPAATEPMRSTMTCYGNPFTYAGLTGTPGMMQGGTASAAAPSAGAERKCPAFCPNCGTKTGSETQKFCAECGSKL